MCYCKLTEVLPMVSDILTVTAFIVLITMKLLPVISEIGEGIYPMRLVHAT